MPAARDFYQCLGVPRDADDEPLKRAYKKQAVKYHPDKHASKSEVERAAAESKFKDVAEAFEVLSDKDKRAVYDRFGEEGLKQGGGCQPPPGGGMGGMAGMPGFGGVHFSFSGPGGGGGMDAARAEAMFSQFFAKGGGSPFGGGGSPFGAGDDDPFASLMGIGGMGGGMGGFGGMGGGPKRRRPSSSASAVDTLPAGTVVRLTGLSSGGRNGAAATVREYDATRQRYVVELTDGESIAVKPSNVRQVLTDAKVVGTSKAELNGKVAAAATFDAASGRYQCEGLTDGTVVSLKPENVMLPQDCRVTVAGVASRPALNGRVGRVAAVDRDRYVVQLAQPDETVSLRFGAVAAC